VIAIEIDNRSGTQVDEAAAVELAQRVLGGEGVESGELGLAFVGPEESRALKQEHLGIDEATDALAFVADALALVRLGWAHLANLCGRLADHLLVGSLDEDLGRGRHLECDAGARLDRDGVGVADAELEVGALERGAVADALDLELLLEALRHALDHVRHERPRQAVQRAILAALGRPLHRDDTVGLLDLHPRRDLLLQRAERAGDRDAGRLDRDGDAVGDLDGCVADSAHCITR